MPYEQYTTDDFLLDDRFVAYCRGSDPDAVAFWANWQRQAPASLPAFREAERMYALLSGQKSPVDASFHELETRIAAQNVTPVVDFRPRPSRTSWRWAAAASVLFVLGLGGWWLWANQTVTHTTAYGQQLTVTLPDNSTVTLNSHSTLQYRRRWSVREVKLTGEGFFSVRHLSGDPPFRVTTDGPMVVEVLGTEFTLKQRPGLSRVVLNMGRIAVSNSQGGAALLLAPGEMAQLDESTGQLQRAAVQATNYNAWLRNQLVFDGTRFAEVIRTIEEQFGVRVRVDGVNLANRTFSGVLPLNDAGTVLNAFAAYNQLTVTRQGATYRLTPSR